MVISRRRFAENSKEMHGIKKKHVKGVQNFCFCQLSMQMLWRRRCSRVVDLKLLLNKHRGAYSSKYGNLALRHELEVTVLSVKKKSIPMTKQKLNSFCNLGVHDQRS